MSAGLGDMDDVDDVDDVDDDPEAMARRIDALQREIAAAQHELVALQKRRARAAVDDALLVGPDGPAALSALFGDRDELVVSFNMGRGCAYCTLWGDAADGVVDHLERVASFVVVSPDPPDVQAAFAGSRGWRFRMVSDPGSAFAAAMGFAVDVDGQLRLWPGVATFARDPGSGGILRTAAAVYGPGDPFCSVYHYLALLGSGGEGFTPTASGARAARNGV